MVQSFFHSGKEEKGRVNSCFKEGGQWICKEGQKIKGEWTGIHDVGEKTSKIIDG